MWRERLRNLDGVLLVLFSSAWFSATTLLVKLIGPDTPAVWVAFMRSAVAVPLIAAFMLHRGVAFNSKRKQRLVMRGIWGISAMIREPVLRRAVRRPVSR
jgi:drug/metabolite transporter (DMT)-like permease